MSSISKHADLLNDLDQMASSLNYALRRPTLILAEVTIVGQEQQIADLLAACQAALAVLPGLEVRSWPPGHELKRKAIEKLKAAIEKATPTAHSPPGESETP